MTEQNFVYCRQILQLHLFPGHLEIPFLKESMFFAHIVSLSIEFQSEHALYKILFVPLDLVSANGRTRILRRRSLTDVFLI